MTETVYSARPALADPAGFLGAAVRDLARGLPIGWRMFRADLVGRRRRSLLGWLWLLVPAAAATGICVYLQSRRVFEVAATELPYAVHVLAGMVLWQVFVDAMTMPLHRLSAARTLVTRTRVPHEAVIAAAMLAVGLNALIRLAALALAMAGFGVAPAAQALLLPVAMLALVWLGGALGLVAAPLGLMFDDVREGLIVLAGFWFFLTPVIYPAPPAGALRLNPVSPLLETGRSWLTGGVTAPGFVLVAGLGAAGFAASWLLYRLARPHVVARMG